MKKIIKVTSYVVVLISICLGVWHLINAQSPTQMQNVSTRFKGDLLAIADADMVATAYANGTTNKLSGIEDSLIYIACLGQKPQIRSQLHVSNSVISWPAILEWHPPERLAYVAETRGKISAEQHRFENVFDDFPKGAQISIVDFQDHHNPKVVQQKKLGENLQNISINRQGDLLVAGSTETGKEMIVATLIKGLIDQVYYFSDDDIDHTDHQDGGFRNIEFHPIEDIIAVNLNGKSVAFYHLDREADDIKLREIGQPVAVEKKLSVGNWHPSGQYFIVSNVNWGNGALGAVFNRKGHLISIQFDAQGDHRMVSKVKVGLSPEGFDISPNGVYAIAVNMRRTYLPLNIWFAPGKKRSSLSLVKIDSTTGHLSVLGEEYGFEGILPEDAVFDSESNSVAVAVYHDREEEWPDKGWIDFWEIENDKLIKTTTKLYVTRGVHNLLLAP